MIDTGYSGFLTLPVALVAELGLPYVFSSSATLADDTEVGFSVHRVTAVWDGNPRNIEADAVGATPLVGMALRTPIVYTWKSGTAGALSSGPRSSAAPVPFIGDAFTPHPNLPPSRGKGLIRIQPHPYLPPLRGRDFEIVP